MVILSKATQKQIQEFVGGSMKKIPNFSAKASPAKVRGWLITSGDEVRQSIGPEIFDSIEPGAILKEMKDYPEEVEQLIAGVMGLM